MAKLPLSLKTRLKTDIKGCPFLGCQQAFVINTLSRSIIINVKYLLLAGMFCVNVERMVCILAKLPNINSREGKEVKLRCIIKRKNSEYVGVCLEFSLTIKTATMGECKEELNQAIEEYIKTIFILTKQGKKVGTKPVEFYLLKKMLFDVRFALHKLCRNDDFGVGFIKRTVVPVGV